MVGEISGAVLVAGGAMFMVIKALKERKATKAGLGPNPTRCIEAEKRITAVEICAAEVKVQIAGIDKKVDTVHDDVKRLLELHLKN